jgi:hypothetical protein
MLSAIVSIQDPMERLGYVAVQAILVIVIFYSAVQVIALKPLIRRHLKILMFVSLLPVLAKGIVPLELMAWIFLALVPSMMLLKLFKPSTETVPATASGQDKPE